MRDLRLLVISVHTSRLFLSCCCCVSLSVCLHVGVLSGTESQVSCVVAVINQLDAVNISNGFTYKSQLTPVIAEVSPRRGGTAGGTRLTITGSGFRCSEGRVSVMCTHDTMERHT